MFHGSSSNGGTSLVHVGNVALSLSMGMRNLCKLLLGCLGIRYLRCCCCGSEAAASALQHASGSCFVPYGFCIAAAGLLAGHNCCCL
jgi:hypothetical protein